MQDFRNNWRDSRLYHLRFKYEKYAKKWIEEQRKDDRGLFCSIYEYMIEALESLPENPHNFVCVAMNHHMKEERATLDNIIERFKDR